MMLRLLYGRCYRFQQHLLVGKTALLSSSSLLSVADEWKNHSRYYHRGQCCFYGAWTTARSYPRTTKTIGSRIIIANPPSPTSRNNDSGQDGHRNATTSSRLSSSSLLLLLETVHQVGRGGGGGGSATRHGDNHDNSHNNCGSSSSSSAVYSSSSSSNPLLSWESLVQENDEIRNTFAYCASFSNDDGSFGGDSTTSDMDQTFLLSPLDHLMEGQLFYCRQQRYDQYPNRYHPNNNGKMNHPHRIDTKPLPLTWPEALTYRSSRAIVITEMIRPFAIVHVNDAWENLCGYTKQEAYGQPLSRLLHGKDTDVANITSMLHPLLQHCNNNNNNNYVSWTEQKHHQQPHRHSTSVTIQAMETGTVVTNYTKTGRRFRNRVRIGPLYQEEDCHIGTLLSKEEEQNTTPQYTAAACSFPSAPTKPKAHTVPKRPTHFVGVLQEIHDGM